VGGVLMAESIPRWKDAPGGTVRAPYGRSDLASRTA